MRGHRFRFLFGISVEVGDPGAHTGWRRDFGDPLHIRILPEPGVFDERFEMVRATCACAYARALRDGAPEARAFRLGLSPHRAPPPCLCACGWRR